MSAPALLRLLAGLLIRGRHARFLLAELDETFERDIERGRSRMRARRRYVVNTLASALSLWRWTMRIRIPRPGTPWLDVKLGLRMLLKQPGLTLVAVFALSIGIPASLIPFHLIDSLQVALPFDEGDRIVGLRNRNVAEGRTAIRALHDFFVWRDELTTFEAIGAARTDPYNVISEDGRAAPVRGSEITASAFEILRLRPILGRSLIPSDEVQGAPDVVVISHEVWQTRLAGDPDVVGTTIRIGTVPHEVVGVMPEGFMFPMRDLLWLPLRDQPTDFERGMGPDIVMFGRLADGVSVEEAQAELSTIGLRMASEFPDTHEHLRPQVMGYTAMLVGLDKGDLAEMYLIQLIVLALLAIVCGNVGTLVLARTATRSNEIAVRTALGASRGRIVSQLFVESLLLAVVATGVGLVLGDRFAVAFMNRAFLEAPFWFDFGVKPRTVGVGLSVAVFCAGIAGVVPALKATGRHVQRNLQRATTGSGIRFGVGSSLLIIAEVALAIGFLTMGGAVSGSLLAGSTVERGIERDEYLMAISVADFADQVASAHEELARRLEAEPGVRGVAMGSRLPGMQHPGRRVEVEGEDQGEDVRGHEVRRAVVDVGFFDGFGQSVLEGRDFTTADLIGTIDENRTAVIVNTAFVEHVLGGRNPVGRRVRYVVPEDEEPGPWYEIIGVVGHLGMNELDPLRDEGLYHPGAPGEIHPLLVATHVGDDPLAFTARLRGITREVDADAMIQYPHVLAEAPNGARDATRYGTVVLLFVSAIAILLSGAGLYALMSFTVSQRTREIGIRTALGARPGSIVTAIARRAFFQLLAGVILGVVAGRWLIFEVVDDAAERVDGPLMLATFAAFMMVVGMVACLGPTLRGLRIRPVEALKEG
jgi:predicted permease